MMRQDQSASAAETAGVTRRGFLGKALWGVLGLLGAEAVVASLASLWPRATAASAGSKMVVGAVTDFPVASIRYFLEGRFYLSHTDAGFLALNRKCPHLGCIVPWQADEVSEDKLAQTGRFNCPCHVSIFNRYGEVIAGPSPRPLDLHPIAIEGGRVVVDTSVTILRQAYEPAQAVRA